MSDIVERLRENNPDKPTTDRFIAADEIERLRAEVEKGASMLLRRIEQNTELKARAEKAELALASIAYGHGNTWHSADNYRAIALEALAQKEPDGSTKSE